MTTEPPDDGASRPLGRRPDPPLAHGARPDPGAVAERSGLNVGYLSQIENDKASPSLACSGRSPRRSMSRRPGS